MVGLERVIAEEDKSQLHRLMEEHLHYTGSLNAIKVLNTWEDILPKFLKVMPHDYKRILEERKARTPSTGSVQVG